MARQIIDLPEMLKNTVSKDDLLLIRDKSSKQDKRISMQDLSCSVFLITHPVGSIYSTYSSTDNPNNFGGSWEIAGQTGGYYNWRRIS